MDNNNIVNIKEEKQQEIQSWRSCCFYLDKDFTLFFTKYIMLVGLLVYAGYNLAVASECVDKSMWQSILLLVIGIAIPSPSLPKYK